MRCFSFEAHEPVEAQLDRVELRASGFANRWMEAAER
jgi:hypothetical protein